MAESALRALIPRPQEIVAPARSWNPLNPAFRDTLSSAMTNMLGASNVAGREGYDRSRYADMLTGAVDFVPGASEAAGVGDVRREVQQGNYPGAALSSLATLLGIVPVIGDMAGKAVRAAGNTADVRFHPRIDEYARTAQVDPRIIQAGSGSQISSPRVGDVDRLQQLNIQTGENRLPEIAPFNIEDYEGYPIMSSMSDRAAAGDVLLSVNDIPVNVNRRGGQDYMFDPLNAGRVWASDAAVVTGRGDTRMQTMAENLRKRYGKDPLFAPWTMAPTGVDYSTMTGETMLQYAKNNMGKGVLRGLNKDIKQIIPDFPGIDSDSAIASFYSSSGDQRKKVIQLLDKNYRDKGSLTSGEARLSVTDPSQYMARDGTLRNVGIVDAAAGARADSAHPTYNMALSGEGVGRFQQPVQVYELFPQAAMLMGIDPMNPPRNALRALEMKPYSNLITEDIIRGIQARRRPD
jgi:hypothetical protein